ncbi:recombinase family protein [Ethanoligenens harbinense]|uniref:Recombinase n=1 Tax=Ethanoligenens harbinense (strain DSM 18485 / JCM 12961 / CGMCC 1.5033 / YUAN-3) TaxID=663278 RepID=E6U9N1_ETHHY|nr:recombinase family protein [Ethanoligenens harbinense]ADU27317.1 Recombinase [Ethanoligenens harbinense YUAN-3]AVQ96382.1 recombinase [Ethanoligenens harbinense YUAN-3]AYF39040.1 recombinase [Ethanoligenens harbinense]AYF41866.1 recombinase [Ethanoligenens harbinense]QCN92623.1 DUF4368 domain-containing protein [Ethanoligenens harbinense]
MQQTQTVNAGIYCRLSVDDGNLAESESIQTQKAMLTDYCRQHHFHIVDYFVDDGCSGTNFDRPEFQRMLAEIEAGRINTVICKDLSRFGRNYYEAGMYLDQYFVQRDIRFIAPGDNVDTSKGPLDLSVPVLNMMNDFYARGISQKTKAAKITRAKQGMFIGSKAPYGYCKDPADKHHLLVDEEAAAVVRRIFAMAADGQGYNRIARALHAEGIPNPMSYFNEKHPDYFKSPYWKRDTQWHVTSIQKILENPVYLGCMAQCRVGNKTMKGKTVKKPREDWIVVENTHEALVTAEQWELVHRQLAIKRRARKDGEPQMFAGLLYCSDCGSALSFSTVHRKTKPDGGRYKCWLYMRHGKEACTSHYISLDQISAVVLNDIRKQARYACLYRDTFLKKLKAAMAEQESQSLKQQEKEDAKMRKRIAALDGIIKKLLEQNASGAITDERFAALTAEYENEQAGLKETLTAHEQAAQAVREAAENAERFTQVIKDYTDLHFLDSRILHTLIQRIEVYPRQVDEQGCRTQRVDICYNFIGMTEIEL